MYPRWKPLRNHSFWGNIAQNRIKTKQVNVIEKIKTILKGTAIGPIPHLKNRGVAFFFFKNTKKVMTHFFFHLYIFFITNELLGMLLHWTIL